METTCGNCIHYKPHRDPCTGRVHPSKVGRCGWKPEAWPMAHHRYLTPVYAVWSLTDATRCECFAPVKKTTK